MSDEQTFKLSEENFLKVKEISLLIRSWSRYPVGNYKNKNKIAFAKFYYFKSDKLKLVTNQKVKPAEY